MNRREIAVWTFASFFWLTITVVVILNDSFRPREAERPPPGVMEKEFRRLNKDMTKDDVEAILGEPIVEGRWWGGSKTPCNQFWYTWRGDDGEIRINYASTPLIRLGDGEIQINNDKDTTIWGLPGKKNRIETMNWYPN